MRRFLSFLAVPAIALGLMAFEDPGKRYTIDFPPDWKDLGATSGGYYGFQAPDGFSACAAKIADVPGLASVTQDQINAEFSKPIDAAAWVNLLGADPSLVVLVDAEARDIGGMFIQLATLDLKPGFEGVPIETNARYAVLILPGRILIASCLTKPEDYPAFKELFDKTVSSIRPL